MAPEPATVRHQAAATLRAAILDGVYEPGRRLTERELVDLLGVSRATVREALGDLRAAGLVTLVPQRGAVVAVLDPREAADLYEIRYRVETLVVELFVARADDSHVDRLTAAIEDLAVAATTTAPASDLLARRDAVFGVLLDGAQSTALRHLTEAARSRLDVLRATSIADVDRLSDSLPEWRDLASAIRRRDADLAVALYGAHLRKAADVALRTLPR